MPDDIKYDFNDGRCFDPRCRELIKPIENATWLADDAGTAFPFHDGCADGAWPMGEVNPPKTD